jgi:hypothetical protein
MAESSQIEKLNKMDSLWEEITGEPVKKSNDGFLSGTYALKIYDPSWKGDRTIWLRAPVEFHNRCGDGSYVITDATGVDYFILGTGEFSGLGSSVRGLVKSLENTMKIPAHLRIVRPGAQWSRMI